MSTTETAILIVVVLVGVGAFFGIVLALADRKFYMQQNPLIAEVEDVLPKGQCGACGFAGCAKYAEAVVENPDVAPNLCVPGKAAVAAKVAALTGKDAGSVEERKAHVLCRGGKAARDAARYEGVADCAAAKLVHAVDVRQQVLEQHGLDPERVERQTAPPVKGLLSEHGVDEQPSVRRDPAQDSLRRTGRGAAPRADINHAASLPLFHMPNIIRRIVKEFYPFVEKERKACI